MRPVPGPAASAPGKELAPGRARITITRGALERALERAGSHGLAEVVWDELATTSAVPPRDAVTLQSVAWYGGGTVALVAMSIFLGTGWSDNGPGLGLGIALTYLVAFVALAEVFRRRGHPVPAGLMGTVAVGLVPAVTYAVLSLTVWPGGQPTGTPLEYPDFYAYISGGWVVLEVAVLVASVLAWLRYRLSFILAPLMVAGWFASMDLAEAMAPGTTADNVASAAVSLTLLGGGWFLDRLALRGEAFWLHLGGLLSGYYALVTLDGDRVGTFMAVTGVLGVLAITAALVLRRRVYLVFGASWLFTGLGYLAFEVFGGSLLFPLALALLGVGLVVGGVKLDKLGPGARADG